ncbi:MAG: hypothetical protein M0R17_05280 [Candidatus Omnitrophica bacterium]|nr:hypothetical protein [Candidatus Omnitrophota bacterium]
MFTVTLIDSMVFVEKDHKLSDRISCLNRSKAVATYMLIASYFDVQGTLASDSGIVN